MAIKVSVSIASILRKLTAETRAYIQRVIGDGGTVTSSSDTNRVMRWLKNNNLLDSTELLYLSNAGLSIRDEAGNLRFVEKVYSLDQNATPNDGTQSTELNQPRLVGGIAPRSKVAFSNQNGESRYFTHPEISFAADEAWSVALELNINHSSALDITMLLRNTGTNRGLAIYRGGEIFIRKPDGDAVSFGTSNLVGKNHIMHIIADGAGNVSILINKVLLSTKACDSTFSFTQFVSAFTSGGYSQFFGQNHYYRIQSGAMTPSQITAEYDLLRSWIPEIESVQIGSQVWSTRNFEAVATPEGNVIAEVTENGAVEKITGGNFESGLIGTASYGTGQTGTYTINTTSPISGTQDGRLVITVAGTEFGRPSLNFTTSRVVGKFRRFSFKYKVNSGTCELKSFFKGASTQSLNITLTGSGTYTSPIFKVDGTINLILYFTNNVFDLQIDDVSEQELNWSNATEIYDAVYAATSGTAEEKEYAALKEAAMWCYYDNSADNGAIYGKLYNWYAAKLLDLDMASSGFGWRVPTRDDFNTLVTTLGGASVAGGKLKITGTDYWNSPNTGATNESGFTALGGGNRFYLSGAISNLLNRAYYAYSDNSGVFRIFNNPTTIDFFGDNFELHKQEGRAIRLIKSI